MSDFQAVLHKGHLADYEFLVRTLQGPLGFTADQRLRDLLTQFEDDPSDEHRAALCSCIEREIRYCGSSDVAYLFRRLTGKTPGVEIEEVMRDVGKKLSVKLKPVGTTESQLERLVRDAVEKVVINLSEREQRELLTKHRIGPELQDEVVKQLKKQGKVAVLPMLLQVLGREAVEKLIPGIIISIVGQFIGHEAAKALVARLIARFPAWSAWMGPIVWGMSGASVAIDIQSPAYRKTVPCLLYCGLIALRDGPEDGPRFWTEKGKG